MASMSIEALSNGYFGVSHEAWAKAKADGRVRDEYGESGGVPGLRREVRYGRARDRVPQSNDDGEGDCG